jgi:hypothetical protein
MTCETEVARLVAKIGPDICSSDESDLSTNTEDSVMSEDDQSTERLAGPRIMPWRGSTITTCLTALRMKGLYYGRQINHSHVSRSSKRPPPDGTPLAWISDKYLKSTQ